jgi:hypothetical protein
MERSMVKEYRNILMEISILDNFLRTNFKESEFFKNKMAIDMRENL